MMIDLTEAAIVGFAQLAQDWEVGASVAVRYDNTVWQLTTPSLEAPSYQDRKVAWPGVISGRILCAGLAG